MIAHSELLSLEELVSLRPSLCQSVSLCQSLSLPVSVSASLCLCQSVGLCRSLSACYSFSVLSSHTLPNQASAISASITFSHDQDAHDHPYRVTATFCLIALVIKVLTVPQYPYALSRLTQLAHDSWKGETFQELIAAFPEETRNDAATLVAHVEDLTTKDIKAVYLKQLQGRPALSYSTIAQLL